MDNKIITEKINKELKYDKIKPCECVDGADIPCIRCLRVQAHENALIAIEKNTEK